MRSLNPAVPLLSVTTLCWLAAAPAAHAQAAPANSPPATPAPPDTSPSVTFGGLVDVYYAWDGGRPPSRDRSFDGGTLFGTQPSRHNEFNVNLAFVEVTLKAPKHRARLALQYGTSVIANYAGEPSIGQVSGPALQRVLQEAFAGVRVSRSTWVDGGIFFSNMGMESWISRDNPTYTRSLVADYSPYYSAGVRVVHQFAPSFTARVDVVNGWQTISESDDGKGVGVRLDYTPTPSTTVSYYNLLSDEGAGRRRLFNGIGLSVKRPSHTLLLEADAGSQEGSGDGSRTSRWYGLLAVARAQVTPLIGIAARVERFSDPEQVVVITGPGAGGPLNPALRASGASLGLDVQVTPQSVWRTELRGFANSDALFPDGSGSPRTRTAFFVTSLAVSF